MSKESFVLKTLVGNCNIPNYTKVILSNKPTVTRFEVKNFSSSKHLVNRFLLNLFYEYTNSGNKIDSKEMCFIIMQQPFFYELNEEKVLECLEEISCSCDALLSYINIFNSKLEEYLCTHSKPFSEFGEIVYMQSLEFQDICYADELIIYNTCFEDCNLSLSKDPYLFSEHLDRDLQNVLAKKLCLFDKPSFTLKELYYYSYVTDALKNRVSSMKEIERVVSSFIYEYFTYCIKIRVVTFNEYCKILISEVL